MQRNFRPQQLPPVPTLATVRPGAAVAIVLKQDQPTGRLSRGVVGELLTRGNHPRGIKVRLRDGRVGRVQQMIESSSSSSEGDATAATLANGMQSQVEPAASMSRARYRDIRLDEPLEEPPAQHELSAYIKPARVKKGRAKAAASDASFDNAAAASIQPTATDSATAKCPVCGEFEGDEAAVAHHVEAHFTEAPCG